MVESQQTELGATKLGVQFEKFLVTDRAQILGVFLRGLLKYILKVSGFLFFIFLEFGQS